MVPSSRSWKTVGFEADTVQASLNDEGLLAEVIRRREPVVTADGDRPAAPAFAALPSDRAAIAIPLLVASQPVAVLYADDASPGPAATPASWPEAVQILGRHASVNLAHLTAARAVEAMRRSAAPPTGEAAPRLEKEDGTSARRYARLLVSEIKLTTRRRYDSAGKQRDLLAQTEAGNRARSQAGHAADLRQWMPAGRSFNRSSCRRWPTAMPRSSAILREDPHVPSS